MEEGVKAKKAKDWNLVDTIIKKSDFDNKLKELIEMYRRKNNKSKDLQGIKLKKIEKKIISNDHIKYSTVELIIDRVKNCAKIVIYASDYPFNEVTSKLLHLNYDFWPLRCARELDDAILHLRFNELDIGVIIFSTNGDINNVKSYDKIFHENSDYWLINEIKNYWERTLKRIDVTSRSLVTLIEPGSCFVGFLSELLFCADRSM